VIRNANRISLSCIGIILQSAARNSNQRLWPFA
jgi:hypothetical protein